MASSSAPMTVLGNLSNVAAAPQDVPLGTLASPGNPVGDALKERLTRLFQQPGSGSISRVLSDRFKEGTVSLEDYRAATDADDTNAFKRSVAALSPRGGCIELPNRDIVIGGQVTITSPIWIQGKGWSETDGAFGTRLVLTNPTLSPFVANTVAAKGCRFTDFAIKQNHPAPVPNWAPTNYAPVFDWSNVGGALHLHNIIGFGVRALLRSFNSGRPFLSHIFGEFYDYVLDVDVCLDCNRVDHVHVWPFVNNTAPAVDYVREYTQAHLDVIVSKRNDTPFWDNIFVIFGRSGVRFSDAGSGVTTRFTIGKLHADGCKQALWADASTNSVQGHAAEVDHQGIATGFTSIPYSTGVLTEGLNADISIGKLASEYAGTSAVNVGGSANRLDISQARIIRWGCVDHFPAFAVAMASPPNAVHLGNEPRLVGQDNNALVNATNGVLEGFPRIEFQPGVQSAEGALGAFVASGYWTRRNRKITYTFDVVITNAGSASGVLLVSLPRPSDGTECIGVGKIITTGQALTVQVEDVPGRAHAVVSRFDNTSPIATGARITGTVEYWCQLI